MGKRRQREEEHENHERWLVSYADFISLLFAFFVVMYAVSSVNEGKYRVLSSALNTAFRDGSGDTDGVIVPFSPIQSVAPPPQANGEQAQAAARALQREQIALLSRQIKSTLGLLVKDGQAHVSDGAYGLTIDINSGMLFTSGDARLNPEVMPAVKSIAAVLASSSFPIVVEGHTDNAPINTAQFPSNWELSGMRASSLVRVFVENGVSPVRLSSVGYADQRPLSDNATAAGRERNRRVSIVIAAPGETRPAGALAPR